MVPPGPCLSACTGGNLHAYAVSFLLYSATSFVIWSHIHLIRYISYKRFHTETHLFCCSAFHGFGECSSQDNPSLVLSLRCLQLIKPCWLKPYRQQQPPQTNCITCLSLHPDHYWVFQSQLWFLEIKSRRIAGRQPRGALRDSMCYAIHIGNYHLVLNFKQNIYWNTVAKTLKSILNKQQRLSSCRSAVKKQKPASVWICRSVGYERKMQLKQEKSKWKGTYDKHTIVWKCS